MGIFTEYMKGELWCFSGTWFVYLMPKSKKDFFHHNNEPFFVYNIVFVAVHIHKVGPSVH